MKEEEERETGAARGRAARPRRNSPRAFALNTLLPFLLAYLLGGK